MADTIASLITEWTERYGHLPAIVDKHGSVTFAELEKASREVAHGLLAAGIGKGAHVGIMMPNGADFLAALFGVQRIGAVAVLISTLARPAELTGMIRGVDVALLLCAQRYLRNDYSALLEDAFPGLRGASSAQRLRLKDAPCLRGIWMWGDGPLPAWSVSGQQACSHSFDAVGVGQTVLRSMERAVAPGDAALMIFTSGSSATPKAVMHSQRNFVHQGETLASCMEGCGPSDRIVSTMPFFWVGGLCTVVMAAFCSGVAVLCPDDPSQEATIACLRDGRATHIMHWPQQLALMKDNPEFVRLLKTMRPAYPHQLELFGLASLERNPNTLGMTEALGPHCMNPMAPLPENKIGSFGRPIGGIEHRIINPRTGAQLPAGVEGQLCLRGGALMTGIYGLAHKDVFDADGFYRTDDFAKRDADGYLYFTGRRGDVVKINGANVSPLEVEDAIRAIAGVKAVCVVGVAIGVQDVALAAAIIPEDGAKLDVDALRGALKTKLSGYKAPRHIVFLRDDEMPMTATAKINKSALKLMLAERIGAREALPR